MMHVTFTTRTCEISRNTLEDRDPETRDLRHRSKSTFHKHHCSSTCKMSAGNLLEATPSCPTLQRRSKPYTLILTNHCTTARNIYNITYSFKSYYELLNIHAGNVNNTVKRFNFKHQAHPSLTS